MNHKTILLIWIPVICFIPSCRSEKKSGVSDSKNERGPAIVEKAASSDPIDSKPQTSDSLAELKALNLRNPTYASLAKEFEASRPVISWPATKEQEEESRQFKLRKLDRRKELLFSIPVSDRAAKDRIEAWNRLEIEPDKRGGFFDPARNEYSKSILNKYLDAPQIDKLVIWETIRTRLDPLSSGARIGNAIGEIHLRFELARLLFSALGIEKPELFDAVDLKTSAMSDDAGRAAGRAEEEIEKLNMELSKKAEKILEQHWKRYPQ